MLDDAKPYPAYKDSGHPWLGDVPEHWEVKKLKHCVDRFYSGGTPESGSAEFYCAPPEGTAWLMISDLTRQRRVRDAAKHITDAGRASRRLEVLPSGTLLYSMYASLGTVARLAIPAAVNQAIIGIAAREDIVDGDHLLLQLEALKRHVRASSSESTQANLNAEKVRNLPIIVPPPAEQAGVVKVLGATDRRVNRLVRAKRRLLGLLAEQKQAVITHAVTRGLNPHAPTQPSGVEFVGDVPSHWDVQRLSTVCVFRSGKAHEPFVDEDGHFVCVNARFVSTDGKTRKHCTQNLCAARKHDVLMVMSDLPNGRALARAFQADEDDVYAVNQRVCALTATGVNPRYLFYYANRNLQLLRHDDGWNQTHLSNGDYKTMRVLLPLESEQEEIAEYLDDFSTRNTAAADLARREIDLIREYRTRLVADVVTGKLDVRAVAETLADEPDPTGDPAEPEALDEVEDDDLEDTTDGETEED